jgi:hypothetical protein
MGWSGGNYSKGNAATGGWAGDASLGIGIEAGRHDTQDNDFATGINQCINKDGSNAFTGNPNLGGYIPTNLGAGTAAAPALCVNNDTNTGVFAPAADTWAVATNGTERMRIDSTGNVAIRSGGTTSNTKLLVDGIGTTDATYATTIRNSALGNLLYLRDDGLVNTGTQSLSPYNKTLGVGANLYVESDGTLARATSSIKYKTEVTDYDKGLSEILSLRSVYYKDKNAPTTQYAGLIAEEVASAGMSEFIQVAADGSPDGLSYGHMMSLVVNAFKQLNAKVEALEAQIEMLQTQVAVG